MELNPLVITAVITSTLFFVSFLALWRANKTKQTALIRLAELNESQKGLVQRHESLAQRFTDIEDALRAERQAYQKLNGDYIRLQTTLEKREEYFQEQLKLLESNKQALSKEFELLAHRIFDEKGKQFTQTSQNSLDNLLKPFKAQLEGFQKRVNEVHDISIQGNTSLKEEIKKVLSIGLQMSDEAKNLASALKGDAQKRGAWGEAQLERTLQMSGLIKGEHYQAQAHFKDTQNKNAYPDYLIKLPDGKNIVIDSKVTLNAYDNAIAAETPEQFEIAMREHCKAVRNHMKDLESKDYAKLPGIESPDFVLMFMPIEPAYIEALKSDPALFEDGYRKGIVLVSHTTLIPILRTVANLWQMDKSNKQAREISQQADKIYENVITIAERLQRLGVQLNTVSNSYNSVVTSLSGNQGLYGKVERFKTFSSKELPQLEPQYPDIEVERLEAVPLPNNRDIS